MYFTVYKITNNINNKYYIGKHQTNNLDDCYMGSGKILRYAIKKYGIENFTKEILFVFDNEQEMNDKEKELVVVSEETYNLCEGGKGGFSFINSNGLNGTKLGNLKFKEKLLNNNFKKIFSCNQSLKLKNYYRSNQSHWLGKTHLKNTKEKISSANKKMIGNKNSQYGTRWITNGLINKKIKYNEEMPINYWLGRVIKK